MQPIQWSSETQELLDQLTPMQRRWVFARLETNSDREAALMVGVHEGSVSRWHKNSDVVRRAVQALDRERQRMVFTETANVQASAMTALQRAVLEAVKVKVDALKSRNERIRQEAASEILDRVLGKAVQRTEDLNATDQALGELLRNLRSTLPDSTYQEEIGETA